MHYRYIIFKLVWINKFIDLTEIRQKGIYHNKNERLIITTMLEVCPVSNASKNLRYMPDMACL